MATRTRHTNGNLAAAMTLLIQTQAQFVAELAETRKEFAAMRQDLETIKAVLVRHEVALEKLTEAIRRKSGLRGTNCRCGL
jgi:predicted  nucleic acid-binding Zn-ribbon protein